MRSKKKRLSWKLCIQMTEEGEKESHARVFARTRIAMKMAKSYLKSSIGGGEASMVIYQDKEKSATSERSDGNTPSLSDTQTHTTQIHKTENHTLKDFDKTNKVLFWLISFEREKTRTSLSERIKRFNLFQSREHLFSVWLKDEEECKIVVNGDKEIVLELLKDILME